MSENLSNRIEYKTLLINNETVTIQNWDSIYIACSVSSGSAATIVFKNELSGDQTYTLEAGEFINLNTGINQPYAIEISASSDCTVKVIYC